MASEGRRVIGAIVAAVLWPVMTALARREPAERASIWSLGRQSARVFFPLAFLLWTLGLAWCAYDTPVMVAAAEAAEAPRVLWYQVAADYIERTLRRFGDIAIPLTITAMILSPVLTTIGRTLMTLSQWITANWVTPYIQKAEARGRAEGISEGLSQGISQGISEGLSQGISQGVAKSNAEWRAWLERKDAAEAQGLAFDEPPPDDRE